MKTHLNTLFVTTEGAYLAKDGRAVVVRVDKQARLRVPLINLDGIVCFGRVGCSPALMAACAEAGVTISFLSPHGRFRAAVVGFTPGNVLLRRRQYRVAEEAIDSLDIARSIVIGKIANCRSVLLRAARDAGEAARSEPLQNTARRLAANLVDIRQAAGLDQLRGLEGEAAVSYFAAFNGLQAGDDEAFRYTKRSRRPPLDPLNALLSFVYSLLMHDARSACEASGLDAAVGFLHRDSAGASGHGAGLDGGVSSFSGRPAGLFADQPQAGGRRRIRESGNRRRGDERHHAQVRPGSLAAAQTRDHYASVSR